MVSRSTAPDPTESFVFNALRPHSLLASGFSWGQGLDCNLFVLEKNICRVSVSSVTEFHHHHFQKGWWGERPTPFKFEDRMSAFLKGSAVVRRWCIRWATLNVITLLSSILDTWQRRSFPGALGTLLLWWSHGLEACWVSAWSSQGGLSLTASTGPRLLLSLQLPLPCLCASPWVYLPWEAQLALTPSRVVIRVCVCLCVVS